MDRRGVDSEKNFTRGGREIGRKDRGHLRLNEQLYSADGIVCFCFSRCALPGKVNGVTSS